MRLAAGLLAAATVTAVAAVPASAAPKPKPKPVPKVCNIIADDPGDASNASQIPSDDSQDIIGGDFASNGKKLTGIIRLKSLAQQNPRAPLGQAYYVLFKIRGSDDVLTLSAGLFPTGNEFTYGYQGKDPNTDVNTSYTLGKAAGEVKGNEIFITADIAAFPQKALLKNGNSVTELTAEARGVYGQRVVPSQQVGPARAPLGGVTLTFDTATGKPYVLGNPSCVAIK